MWIPTHVKLTVHRARNLYAKGKHGKNDAFVVITFGKQKFQTTVLEKSEAPEWQEECDLLLPAEGPATSEPLILNIYHRNLLGDDFLGRTELHLNDFSVYDKPRSQWVPLRCKPSKKKPDDKERGELEIKVAFNVQSRSASSLSLNKVGKSPGLKAAGSLKSLAAGFGSNLKLSEKLRVSTDKLKFPGKKKKKSISKVNESPLNTPEPSLRRHDTYSFADDNISQASSHDVSHDSPMDDSRSNISITSSVADCNTNFSSPSFVEPGREEKDYSLDVGAPRLSRDSLRADDACSGDDDPRKLPGKLAPSGGDHAGLSLEDRTEPKMIPVEAAHASEERLLTKVNPSERSGPQQKDQSMPTSPAKPPRKKTSVSSLSLMTSSYSEADLSKSDRGPVGLSTSSKMTPVYETTLEESSKVSEETETLQKPKCPGDAVEEPERVHISRRNNRAPLPPSVQARYADMTREELIQMVERLKDDGKKQETYRRDLESYIDNLLVRVMETQPRLLQNPWALRQDNLVINTRNSNSPAVITSAVPKSNKDLLKKNKNKKSLANPLKRFLQH